MLSEKAKTTLLRLARQTLGAYLASGRTVPFNTDDPELLHERGLFVTLKSGGKLRGCIGRLKATLPLYQGVQETVLDSAFRDPRFWPLSKDELNDITIEISVLSPLRKIQRIEEIELGRHGLFIRKGESAGSFLPQVAQETGWSVEEFLGHCAQDKAGIGWEGWKSAQIFVFTADVFSEENPPHPSPDRLDRGDSARRPAAA